MGQVTNRAAASPQRPTKKPSRTAKPPAVVRFSDHIAELRRRLFFVAAIFLVASSLAYNYRDTLLQVIMSPLDGQKLVYLTPGGGFNFIFQISLYAGLLAAAPMVIYQLYGFIRPALPAKAQRSSGAVVASAFALMVCGVLFGYFVAIPSALHFLATFAGEAVTPNLTADSYLSFFLAYIAGLGVLFELPLLLLFVHWIHPMSPGGLLKSERFVILFAFVAAALITPTPDMLNQAMIAIPLIAIYQAGVIVVLMAIRKERRRVTQAQILPESKVQEPVSRNLPQGTGAMSAVPRSSPAKPVTIPQTTRLTMRPSLDGFAARRPATARPISPRSVAAPTRPVRPQRPAYPRSLSVDGFPVR